MKTVSQRIRSMEKYITKDEAYLEVSFQRTYTVGDVYCLQWFFPEEEGGFLGEFVPDDLEEKAGYEACLKVIVELEPKQLAGTKPHFWFERLRDAKSALLLVNSAMMSAKENKTWPDWALIAVANGWKVPKGWKP